MNNYSANEKSKNTLFPDTATDPYDLAYNSPFEDSCMEAYMQDLLNSLNSVADSGTKLGSFFAAMWKAISDFFQKIFG